MTLKFTFFFFLFFSHENSFLEDHHHLAAVEVVAIVDVAHVHVRIPHNPVHRHAVHHVAHRGNYYQHFFFLYQ